MNLYSRIDDCVVSGRADPEWKESFDIIVVGAGSGGIYGSLSAAREGKSVLLLEKSRWCGGQHVQGLVNGYYYGCRDGLFRETDRRAEQQAKDVFYDVATDGKRILIADELCDAGICVRTQSMAIGIYCEEKTVCGIRALIGCEVCDFACKMLIDATSDGHLLRMLPIEVKMGREGDGEPEPFSSVRSVYLDRGLYDGGLSVTVGKMGGRYGLFHEYRDNGYLFQYNRGEFTKGIVRAHASHLKFIGENSRFLHLASMIGLREGVLYEGECYLTLSDVLYGRIKNEDIMLWCFSDVDKHGSGMAFDEEIYQNWFVCSNMSTCTIYIPIPIGAVVPKGWKGLTTAGRCISADTYVNSATRMNTDCFRIGEAVGTLCALAADCGQDPMAVSPAVLREKLTGYGFFREQHSMQPSFWNPGMAKENRVPVSWMTDKTELKRALSTDCPAVALWSCHLMGKEKLGDTVYALMDTDDTMLRFNAAIALGIMHDERALSVLHEIIENRGPFYYMDCRRSNQMRSVIAECLCGQMGDAGAVDALLPILEEAEYDKEMYHILLTPDYKRTITKEQNSVYFQHFSHAVAALTKIALKHPERREEIRAKLHAALDDGAYIRRITDTPEWNAFYKAADNCRKFVTRKLG